MPSSYNHLLAAGITHDYSMGFADRVGFRAGTCTPFYFYDLDFEIQTPLKVFPFALMDTTLNDYMKLTPKQSLGRIRDLKNQPWEQEAFQLEVELYNKYKDVLGTV